MRITRVLSLLLLYAVFFPSCSPPSISGRRSHRSVEGPGPQPAAKTTDEWIDRLHQYSGAWRIELNNLYAELPSPDHWEDASKALLVAPDARSNWLEKDKRKSRANILKCFAAMLEGRGSEEAMLAEYKTLLRPYLSNRNSGYPNARNAREHHLYLIVLGSTKEDADAFMDDVFPDWEEEEKNSSKQSKDEWKTALAEDRVDEGIALLWEAVKKADKSERFTLYGKLYDLAVLLNRPDLEVKALTQAESDFKKIAGDEGAYIPYGVRFLFKALVEGKQWLKIRELSSIALKSDPDEEEYLSAKLMATLKIDGAEGLLKELSLVSDQGVKTQELFLKLLVSDDKEFGRNVCRAMRETGKQSESETLLHYLIAATGGYDPYYRDLLKYYRKGAEVFLKQLMNYDPFEERPLIWLAHLALEEGDVAQARQWVERAIALDPSDGDQGKESRMEAYKVLSAVYAAEGNAERANFFTDVTEAIREGEKADDYLNAGLRNEAIRRYQKALGRFEDAYCLQSRLAKTLVEQGRIAEAEKHFVKAFELMPVSFGPVESHCFGCEGAFNEKESQVIAERVFKKVIETTPDNPRTYYLLGLVFEKRGEKEDAFRYYLEAFRRDPLYYNCAIKIENYLRKHPEHLATHQETLRQILKISPYYKLPDRFADRIDLKQAWLDADALTRKGSHPLTLKPLPLPFVKGTPNAHKSSYISNQIRALAGWSREDLLRSNSFLSDLSSLE